MNANFLKALKSDKYCHFDVTKKANLDYRLTILVTSNRPFKLNLRPFFEIIASKA